MVVWRKKTNILKMGSKLGTIEWIGILRVGDSPAMGPIMVGDFSVILADSQHKTNQIIAIVGTERWTTLF